MRGAKGSGWIMDLTSLLYAGIGGGLGGLLGGPVGSFFESKFGKEGTEKGQSMYYLIPMVAFVIGGWRLVVGLYDAGVLPKIF